MNSNLFDEYENWVCELQQKKQGVDKMKYIIEIIAPFVGILTIFNIAKFIYNLMKLDATNINEDERKTTLKKLCIYGVLSAICGCVFILIALNSPGPAHLV